MAEKEKEETGRSKKRARGKAIRRRSGRVKLDPRLTPRFKELKNQVIAADMEMERLKAGRRQVKGQIVQYRERIEKHARRGSRTWRYLTRDYNNTREPTPLS